MTFRFFHSCTLICLALTGWAATEVQNHQVLQNLSGSQGSETHFFIQVPSGADTLTITISGGSGDPDLYVRQGSPATRSQYDCRPYLNGPNEECQIDQPSGIYYILVRGYTAYSGLSLTAAYNDGSPLALASGVPLGPLSGAQDEQLNFYLDVPQGASDLRFEISGGNGDPDLYVRYGSQPSLTQYDCRPWLNGPNELCAIAQPQAGTYFVMLVGYNAFSGLTLSAQFEPPADCGPDDTSWISMNDLGDGTVTQNQYASYVRLMGSGLANYQIEICQPAQLGTVTFDYDPIQIGGGYDQYFTYTYSHLGPRPNNADSFQIKASKNGNTALKTLKLNLQNPIVENPVQPNCSNIDVDLDQDGIPDCAEQPGSTFYGMPLYDWGARPNQPDIFIEVDYMPIHELRDYDGNLVLDSHGHPIMDHGTQPLRESLDIITAIYADHGYALHFDIGDLYDQAPGLDPYDYDLGGGEEVPYAEYIHLNRWTDTYHGRTIPIPGMVEDFMPQYFANRPERSRVFYYCLFANSQGGSNRGSSGQAFDTFDQAFYISMGG
ncbi:MAG: PPC domain-containing protein, partial [Acidobacteria bacterium]|nr:PPC domain-containing protein [Acidobacteriota bacterium]